MNTNKDAKNQVWISAYIYYNDIIKDLLIECVAKFINEMRSRYELHRYFFIHYYESGYHMRLRLKVPADMVATWKSGLENTYKCFLNDRENRNLATADSVYIRYSPYLPEIERYGGSEVIAIAEKQFECSSEFVINLLKDKQRQSSLSMAIKINLILMTGLKLKIGEMIQLCNDFVEDWLFVLYDMTKDIPTQRSYFIHHFEEKFQEYTDDLVPAVELIWNELKMETFNDETASTYYLSCLQQRYDYENVNLDLSSRLDIVRSFIHMNNNRLSIRNIDESYIIYLLRRTLETIRNGIKTATSQRGHTDC
ncbi:thiopeptide-type bacteriocin biosynthesis protein [uncultured Pedobacter sp.]|uniref:thiopeptide-type bacteriocin biosynthesis protein n=1 Tax=uncultured Pedobacter sp. TaxID=246139 RepID=UPI0025D99786|nr:thiopeptide-type bacteriocin biosynthesis protein [uncultured Pedobacter sp.]